ncbi:hypothetical protein [Nostoc sp. DSM 114167]|uniref:hypothetical protein n=1 Tax=Nostoc sp. DSM 114167 TaxID=3439050 RepID=UPI00404622B0
MDNPLINFPRIKFSIRNPYCQIPPTPEIDIPGKPKVENLQCTSGLIFVYTNDTIKPLNYELIGNYFSVNWQLTRYVGNHIPQVVGTVTLVYEILSGSYQIKPGSGTGEIPVTPSGRQITDLINSIGVNVFSSVADVSTILARTANNSGYSYLASCPPAIHPTPPPKSKKKECDCMCNDNLVKLLLKRIGSLPASVPDNFTKQNPSYINVESLAELMLWQMQQLDALMGAYPINIEIEDNDLVTEGNQKQTISVPNSAEALAEIMGMMLTIKRDTHAALITAIKAMGEAGMSKNIGIQTLAVAEGVEEFLGYKVEQKKKKVPSLFTPGGKNITETLAEKEIEIVVHENTDTNDLQDDLKILKTMAARWNAQNFRRVGKDSALSDLKNALFGQGEAIKKDKAPNEQNDFDAFTEQVERGFIEVSGVTDTTSPYGRPYDERPKIREIGNEAGRYNNDGTPKSHG